MGVTGFTVLSIYEIITTITIIVLGVILKYDGELVDEDCKEVHMGDGGDLTEIHNKVIKVDFLNNDQAETGRIDSEGRLVCSPCSFSTFTALEIVAITLLVVGILANTGRLVIYVIKLMGKRSLKLAEAKVKRDAQLHQELRREVEIERGMCTSPAVQNIPNRLVEDNGNKMADALSRPTKGMGWEEARTN